MTKKSLKKAVSKKKVKTKKSTTKKAKTKIAKKTSKRKKTKILKISKKTNPKTSKTRAKKSLKPSSGRITKAQLLKAYETSLRSRMIDEKIILLYKQNKCHFQIGCAGHEVVQVAASDVFKPSHDWFYPYYREMALVVGLGQTEEDLFLNAMNKQDDPNSHGRGMPMHYGSAKLNIVNQSSPTGTQFNQAVGCAFASQIKGLDEVTYVSSGEGTCAQGDFHEAINWASRDKLPIVFHIQNNDYAISVHVSEQLTGGSISAITKGYKNLESIKIDGTNYAESYKAFRKAHERALKGQGPTLIESMVPRLQSHSISDNHLKYRDEKDIEKDKKRDPILKLKKEIIKKKFATRKELNLLEANLKTKIDEACEWAEIQPEIDVTYPTEFTYSEPNPMHVVSEGNPQGEEVYMVDALNHALDEELKNDKDVFIFGQDVAGGKGGVFTVTANLTKKYGEDRVFNSQLAESSIVGVAIGMATRGLKPVAEIQFGDYVWTATMQIRNELAMMHYRSGGDFSCPAVIRIPVGGYIHGGPYHSQNIEATMAHFAGLHIVYPSNASDAKGLLKTAIRTNNPVLFLEHKGLYRQVYAKGPEGDKDCFVPIGKAKVLKEGSDATIISWGAIIQKSLLAAEKAEELGYSIEVIDLRSIVPLDFETIAQSISKTNRVMIAHEDMKFVGFGAEISAQITETCFEFLDAPILRVGMKNVGCIGHASVLENAVLPQTDEIEKTLIKLLEY